MEKAELQPRLSQTQSQMVITLGWISVAISGDQWLLSQCIFQPSSHPPETRQKVVGWQGEGHQPQARLPPGPKPSHGQVTAFCRVRPWGGGAGGQIRPMWGQLLQGCPFLGRERAGIGTLTLEWESQSMDMAAVLNTDVWWGKDSR